MTILSYPLNSLSACNLKVLDTQVCNELHMSCNVASKLNLLSDYLCKGEWPRKFVN
jgi:hypothetical protein